MSALVEVEKPEQQFEQSALSVRDEAKAIQIVDQETYNAAAAKFEAVSALEKQITEHYAPMKTAAHEAHKKVCAAEKSMLGPVSEAKQILSRAIGTFDREQEALRRAAELKLEEEARKRAQEEAEKLALDAIDHGASEEEINSIVEEAVSAPLPVVHAAPTYQRASGVITRETWRAELVSLPVLIKAAAENPSAFQQYLTVNLPAANAAARNQKSAFKVPGLIAKSDRGAASRGR
jgi:hypothetical protein